MSLVAELTKLQERKEALLREVSQIDKELDQVAIIVGVKKPNAHSPNGPAVTVQHNGIDPKPKRAWRGDNWRQVEHWLRLQTSAKTSREISDGSMVRYASTITTLSNHRRELIHRGNRWGFSEHQFADHTADLEEQRRGTETPSPSMPPIAPSLNGATDMSSALTTTANTALADTEPAR